MANTNLPITSKSTTPEQSYFDQYYRDSNPVTGGKYDVIYTFVLKKTNNNEEAAKSLTEGLLQLSYNRNVDPMKILDDFKKIESNEQLKVALLAILNNSRDTTSKLGLSKEPLQNQFVVRNIRV